MKLSDKRQERAEFLLDKAFSLYERFKNIEEKYREIMDKRMEMETGFNKEFTLIWLKGKIVMMLPEEWRLTAIRLMTDY